MASTTQETLYDSFKSIAGGLAAITSVQNSVVQAVAGGSQGGGSSVLSDVAKVFTSGLGLAPLVSGLFGLFGGGPEEPPPLVKYTMPDRMYFQGADLSGGYGAADYDQFGMPRAYGTNPPASGGTASAGSAAPSATQQINVTVQAMDSRSFMDHSSEIAQAVRQAMLNLSPINDVVNDL